MSSLWNRCSIKKNIGERSHWHELPLPPVCILQILMDPIPLSAKIINEYPPLLHWHEVSFAYLILITVLYLIWSKGHQEPRNEVGSGPGDIQLLRYHKMVKIEPLPLVSTCPIFVIPPSPANAQNFKPNLVNRVILYSRITTCCNQHLYMPQKRLLWMFPMFPPIEIALLFQI